MKGLSQESANVRFWHKADGDAVLRSCYERGADVIQIPSGAKKLKGFKLVELPVTSLRHQREQALEKLYAIRLG